MSRRTKSLTVFGMAKPTRRASSTGPYASPEIWTYMRQCEAREWLQRYRAKARANGAAEANNWWRIVIADIERIRGLDEAINLRNLMNAERKK